MVLDRRTGAVRHQQFTDIATFLEEGDTLVMNDTRVSAIRLFGHRPTGGAVEALLLRNGPAERTFVAMVKPAKKLPVGSTIEFSDALRATVIGDDGDGLRTLQFDPIADLADQLEAAGLVPLPPYIHESLSDKERYQTVYAAVPGSSAAPTAGLHFTPEILKQLGQMGVKRATVTLDVGIDTFRPVTADDLSDHIMHGERCSISEEAAKTINEAKRRIIAVGTTSVRTLESFAIANHRVSPGTKTTKIFIRPGYEWKVVDGMFTNFHLPKTTMMMMLAAMVGRDSLLAAYREAVEHKYRFLSFGDSMLIE